MNCNIKNKDCNNASPFGGCFAAAECDDDKKLPVIDRLQTEIEEFTIKINKMQNFINTDTYNHLSAYHKALFDYQLSLFNSVVKVLELRVNELKSL